ncbi:MAG: FecR domain-containing protein, partial [Planctomycetia bacterium]|nr:FecR domain-containing protein [Planctomycetia bacterium]
MSTHDPNAAPIGDQNVERLLSQAYRPETPDPALLPRVAEQMQSASTTPSGATVPASADKAEDGTRLLPMLTAMAALLAGLLLTVHALYPPAGREKPTITRKEASYPPSVGNKTEAVAVKTEHLKPRALPATQPVEPVPAGQVLQTAAGQRQRVTLSDGSVLYLNQNSLVRVAGDRQLLLERGEVFIDVMPQQSGSQFVVRAGQRDVTALGTKFSVRNDGQGQSGVVVAQGKVKVSDYAEPLTTGQQLVFGNDQATSAVRTSHLLDWTRDLMAASATPLVPDSKYTGGALVAVDTNGQEAKLSLRKYHVDVFIEDGFARTVIDQTYFNHANLRMEGTFYFPLPADAQLSRLAMYVDGNLMEGGMTERNRGRAIFEEIMYSQRDPALLEWVDGSTFKMRVFPLEARQEKRILIGYTQRLGSLYGQSQYRFPAGHSLGLVNDWSFKALVKNGKSLVVSSDSHPLVQELPKERNPNEPPPLLVRTGEKDVTIEGKVKDARLDRDVVLNLVDPTGGSQAARFSTLLHEGNRYVMLRYRPELKVEKQRQNRDWVFLFESSGDRDPLLARAQIEVLRTLLQNAEYTDKFAVIAAGTRVRTFPENGSFSVGGMMPVTAENVKSAVAFLESTHLIGALDLGQALTAAQPLLSASRNAHLVHVGSGIAAMGERRADALAKKIPQGAHYVGVGVGKRWSRDFMKSAAERTGGYFTQINPDEPIAWRAFDLSATLNTPRLMDVKALAVSRDPKGSACDFLLFSNYLAQGEELCAVARLGADEQLPKSLKIMGNLDGEAFQQEIELAKDMKEVGHLPRVWARLEIDRLLAEDANKNRDKIVELSKQMYVMSPFTSLLVLENDEMYERFGVDRGRKDHWAAYETPKKIEVKYEPEPGQVVDRFAPKTEKPHRNQVLQTILVRSPAPMLTWPNRQGRQGRTYNALTIYRGAFGRPQADVELDNDELLDSGDMLVGFAGGMGGGQGGGIDRLVEVEQVILAGLDAKKDLANSLELLERDDNKPISKSSLQFMNGRPGRSAPTRQRMLREGGGNWAADERRLEMQRGGDVRAAATASPMSPPPGFGGRSNLAGWDGEGRKSVDAMFKRLQVEKGERWGELPTQARGRFEEVAKAHSEKLLKKLVEESIPSPLLYGRPSFSNDDRVFTDLLAYAPGLNSSQADMSAVLEAEAAPGMANLPGVIDPEARPLIQKARAAGWQVLTAGGEGGEIKVAFDGQGRYAYQRTTPLGLSEEVICDGQSIVHIYTDLGLAARRPLSRFHRAEFAQLVPWLLPPVEDLARGADVKKTGDRQVALIPRGAADKKDDDGKPVGYAYSQLTFDDAGRLAERRIIEVYFDKDGQRKEVTHFTETYTDGVVRLTAGDGKELRKRELKLAKGQQPNLKPDLAKLVVLPLPWRAREQAYQAAGLDSSMLYNNNENWTFEYLDEGTALQLLAAEFAQGDGNRARLLHRKHFLANGTNKLGFYTLLTALELPVATDPEFRRLLDAEPARPLARYLALQGNPMYRRLQERWGLYLGENVGPQDNLLQRLASFYDLRLNLHHVMNTNHAERARREVFDRGLAYVTANRKSVLGWAMLSQLQDRAYNEQCQRDIAQSWKQFIDDGELGYVARYENARSMLHGGQAAEAAQLFRAMYEQALKEKFLPPIDHDYRRALLGNDKGADEWTPLMQRTSQALVQDGQRSGLVTLAWQCWQLGDEPLSENLLAAALAKPANDDERLHVTIAAVEYLLGTNQDSRADSLVSPLLTDAQFSKRPGLWRLASRIAERRQQTARAIACLETALDLEFQDLPTVIDLQRVRRDY